MKKEIVPGLYVLSEYLNKLNISTFPPIQVNFGIYILTIKNKEILYYHYFDSILKWDLLSFKNRYKINRVSELVLFFEKTNLFEILAENDVDVFTLNGIGKVPNWGKTRKQLTYRENSYRKIKKMVNRGASVWYLWFFNYCFFGHYDESIYLTDKG